MTDERVGHLLDELDRALMIEPSPELAAKVRRRVAEPRRATLWLSPASFGAAASLGVIAFAAVILWPRAVPPAVEPLGRAAEVTVGVPSSPPLVDRTMGGPASGETRDRRRESAVGRSRSRPAADTTAVSRGNAEVQVPPDAQRVFDRFAADVWAGRVDVGSLAAPLVMIEPAVIVPVMIEVPTIRLDFSVEEPGQSGPPERAPSSEAIRLEVRVV